MKEKFRNGSGSQRVLIAFAEGAAGSPTIMTRKLSLPGEIKMYLGGLEGFEQAHWQFDVTGHSAGREDA
jgi:hypothetical protein